MVNRGELEKKQEGTLFLWVMFCKWMAYMYGATSGCQEQM
jgi:hypothetical protein